MQNERELSSIVANQASITISANRVRDAAGRIGT